MIYFNEHGLEENEYIEITRLDEDGLFTKEQRLSASERNALTEILEYGSKLYESVYK